MSIAVTRIRSFLVPLLLAPAAWAAITISGSVPNGTLNVPYLTTLTCNGDDAARWRISAGSLPPGISLSGEGTSVTIQGTPTTTGTFPFTVTVSEDSESALITGSQSYSITIASPALIFNTTSPLPPAIVGVNYELQFNVTGGTAPYSFTASALPPGLSLTSGGALNGTPTAANNYNFTILVSDARGTTANANFALTVTAALVFGTASPLPAGSAGAPYSATIAVSGGTTPYSFSITTTPPPGVNISAAGTLSGTPSSIGTYSFTVQVIDHLGFTASKTYSVTFGAGTPLLQVSPLALTFTAITGGDTPLPQAVSIVSTNASAVAFATSIDAGTAGTPAPPWISVSPASGGTPTRMLVLVIPSMLTGSSGTATIHVTVAGNTTQAAINIPVTFTISSGTAMLQALPAALSFGARFDAPGIQQQAVIIRNAGGGGIQNFTVTILGNSPWLNVTPESGSTGNNATTTLKVTANSNGLPVGDHHDIIQIAGPNTVDVPVDLFVSSSGPILSLGVTGVRFEARSGNGSARPQSIPVLNLGDPTSTVNWTASLLSGSDWLTISNPHGTATPTQPGSLVLSESPSAYADAAGPRYALVSVTDTNSLNSPQYVVAVLDNQPVTSPALPDPSPAGLYFTSKTGAQQILLYTSSGTPTAFQTAALTNDGASWLAATPTSGVASTNSPGEVTVSVTPPTAAGIYTGYINIGMSGNLVVVNVTLVVLPPGVAGAEPAARPLTTANCTPSQLAMTETGLVNNFAVPAGWPATLVAQLNDNCGNAISNGAIVASFSNNDSPIPLRGDQTTNTYSATWQPGIVLPSMTITLTASSGSLPTVTQLFTGTVNANSSTPPTLLPNGTLDIFFNGPTAAALGGGLAPGNVAQVYGSGLGPSSVAGAPSIPLPGAIDGTYMLVGQSQAPLYFVSSTVMAVEIPFELTSPQQAAAVASVNGALSNVITVTVVPFQPGIAVRSDATAEAQHLDYSLITAASPAKPGETVIIYLAGMGATNPSVASGVPTPSQLVPTVIQPTVTLDSQDTSIVYAGLTPTGIGLYQIDFTVPTNARSGNLNVIVTQNGVMSNTAILPVSN